MATDAPTLLAGSNCYNNYSAQFGLLKLALLQQIALALNPMADTTPQGLLSSANVACYNNYGSWQLLELALLQIIANNGGGGSGGGVTAADYGGGPPSFTPTTSGALAIDTSNGSVWTWYSNAWH
jgi:hypothetical protein